jgi:hypothetical protein
MIADDFGTATTKATNAGCSGFSSGLSQGFIGEESE